MRGAGALALATGVCLAAGLAPSAALCLTEALDPVAVLRSTLDAAGAAQRRDAPRPERLAAVRTAARRMVDTDAMGTAAIGADVLDAQPAAARAEYLRHFDVLIMRTWMQKLLLFEDPRFEFGRPQPRDGATWVETRIVTDRDSYRLDYEMVLRDGRWWVTDIVVEDLSLVESYRGQITSLLEQRGFDELLALMRRKSDRLRAKDER